MALENLTATSRGDRAIAEGVTTRDGYNVFVSTVEASAATNDGSTYVMAYIPSNIRILSASTIRTDDLASTGSPTVDVGLQGNGMTADPDAIGAGFDVTASAGVNASIISNPANVGKYAWEFAGESSDPGGEYTLYFSVDDAAANSGGTMTLELHYWYDAS